MQNPLGFTLGIINDKNNQYDKAMKEKKKKEENKDTVKGNANILKAM